MIRKNGIGKVTDAHQGGGSPAMAFAEITRKIGCGVTKQ